MGGCVRELVPMRNDRTRDNGHGTAIIGETCPVGILYLSPRHDPSTSYYSSLRWLHTQREAYGPETLIAGGGYNPYFGVQKQYSYAAIK